MFIRKIIFESFEDGCEEGAGGDPHAQGPHSFCERFHENSKIPSSPDPRYLSSIKY